ncbi:YybH family protein [Agrilutibacter solisilvae]|uniref:Nuclear transport factor 2 family protein n=1 Tax=Agrilutibacter solisilvae TaxID=2763317 RepID=A0A975ARJ9_9GAMM|nr:nuclear transport factor 2 family protein [Lysobacter solisilvae]QSX77959.1 nuclear transport factor 2 family protein [Lysobacter solisilvae]
MHVLSRSTVAVVLCGMALAAGSAAAKEPAPAGDCFVAGFKAGDADAVSSCYAEDAIVWFPGGSMAKGRQAIREGFTHFFSGVTIKDFKLSQIGEETVGPTKVTWGTYTVSHVDKATQAEAVTHGRYIDVQKKIGGRWLYIVDHPSDDPPPEAK